MRRTFTYIVLGATRAACIAYAAAACGQTTPLGVAMTCNPGVERCEVNLDHVDAAVRAAADLVGIPADRFSGESYVAFSAGPVMSYGEPYYGLCTAEPHMVDVQVMYTSCVFAPDGALLHELVHAASYFATGDLDNGHAERDWHMVDGLRAKLQAQYCPERM